MRHIIFGLTILLALCTCSVGSAQPPTPMGAQRPTFSPYLNLLNRNFTPAGNYFGFVRPQQQMQQQFGVLQNQLNQANQNMMNLQAQGDQLQNDLQGGFGLRPTGSIPTFMNTGHYFSYNPALMGGGMGGGMGRGGMGMMGGGGMGMMGGGMGQGQRPQAGNLPGGNNIGGNRGGPRPAGGAGAGIGGGAGAGIRR